MCRRKTGHAPKQIDACMTKSGLPGLSKQVLQNTLYAALLASHF